MTTQNGKPTVMMKIAQASIVAILALSFSTAAMAACSDLAGPFVDWWGCDKSNTNLNGAEQRDDRLYPGMFSICGNTTTYKISFAPSAHRSSPFGILYPAPFIRIAMTKEEKEEEKKKEEAYDKCWAKHQPGCMRKSTDCLDIAQEHQKRNELVDPLHGQGYQNNGGWEAVEQACTITFDDCMKSCEQFRPWS